MLLFSQPVRVPLPMGNKNDRMQFGKESQKLLCRPNLQKCSHYFPEKGIIGYVYTAVVIETIIQPFGRPGKSFRIMPRLAFIPPVPNSLSICWGAFSTRGLCHGPCFEYRLSLAIILSSIPFLAEERKEALNSRLYFAEVQLN